MKQAVILLMLVIGALEAGKLIAGQSAVVQIVSGSMAVMAVMIAGTFLWLWTERATPLALGMAFSWLGAGLFAGGWWLVDLRLTPSWGDGGHAALVVLGLCLVGAVLHFAVIQRSYGREGVAFLWPILLALVLSGAGALVFGGL